MLPRTPQNLREMLMKSRTVYPGYGLEITDGIGALSNGWTARSYVTITVS